MIGAAEKPGNFTFLIAPNSSVNLSPGSVSGSTIVYAAMYGPEATYSISGDVELYGSLVGKLATLSGKAKLHFDEALADESPLSNEGVVNVLSWRELRP